MRVLTLDRISNHPALDAALRILNPGAALLRDNFSTYDPVGDAAERRSLEISRQSQNRSSGIFGGLRAHGSHAGGLEYVPHDDYRAVLHRGERVQTAREAAAFRGVSGGASGGGSAGVDRAAATISNQMLLAIAKSFDRGEPYYSCAHTASRLVNALGLHITKTASAGNLRKNAINEGWERVPTNQLQRGDLILNRRVVFQK